MVWAGLIQLGYRLFEGLFEHSNDPSGFVKIRRLWPHERLSAFERKTLLHAVNKDIKVSFIEICF
jgi:hypothetical protein